MPIGPMMGPVPRRERVTTWRDRGNCAPGVRRYSDSQVDVMLFPKATHVRKRPWDKLCRSCPVVTDCKNWGDLIDGEGVFGGEYRQPTAQQAVCEQGHVLGFADEECPICQMIRHEAARIQAMEAEAEWLA